MDTPTAPTHLCKQNHAISQSSTRVNNTLQGEVTEGDYGHAVDKLAEVLANAVALGLARRESDSLCPLNVLVLLLPNVRTMRGG